MLGLAKLLVAILLDLGYLLAVLAALPWIICRLVLYGVQRGFLQRFGAGLDEGLRGSIWLHGSSAGEISLLKPLVQFLERDFPDTPLLISAYSSTGHATANKLFPKHRVVFFPYDFSAVVFRFLRHFNPILVVIMESEFWPNFLLASQSLGIPVAVLNGKMSPKSYRLHDWTRFISSILQNVPLIAVQTKDHKKRLQRLGVPEHRVHVTGNMKYDLAQPLPNLKQTKNLREKLGYESNDVVIIGGSLHKGEDDVLIEAYKRLPDQTVSSSLIIVPRYPAEAIRFQQRAQAGGCRVILKTEVDGGGKPLGPKGILIVDTVGELSDLYALADIAFIGGSLFYRGGNKGGHNLMEPAILGLPILFGPYNISFKETVDALLDANAGLMVCDAIELSNALGSLLDNSENRRKMGARAYEVIMNHQGATERNYTLLLSLLKMET